MSASRNPILKDWTVPGRPVLPRHSGAAVTRLNLTGEITVESALPLFAAITAARNDSIEIEIDSGGGNALCALALFELLISHPHHVAATIIGRASSGAAIVAMGADCRRIARCGRFMLHGTTASLKDGDGTVLRSVLADLEMVDAMSEAIFAAAIRLPPAIIRTWRRDATTFDAPGAVAIGLAHELIQN